MLVVFTDYQCGPCRAAHSAMSQAVQQAGDVRVVYRDLPLQGPVSERAARVALATAPQGLYPQVHDAFMREPRKLDLPVMRAIVTRLGGDWARAERDADSAGVTRQLARNRADALRLGAGGTPLYLIGPYRVLGALSEREFARAFDQVRERH